MTMDAVPMVKPCLQHAFMAGLQFETEPVWMDRFGVLRPLPFHGTEDGDALDWMACLVSLWSGGVVSVPVPMENADLASPVAWLQMVPNLAVEALEGQSWHALATVLPEVLAAGGMVMLELALPKGGSRWMLVTGLESEVGTSVLPRLRALLVLDPAVSPVWACGHNAKVAVPLLQGSGATTAKHVPVGDQPCVYRSLDGGLAAGRVLQLVVMTPRSW